MNSLGVRVIKVARAIGFQSGHVIVAAGGALNLLAEAFVEVRLAIAIQVMEAGDLVAAQHEDFSIAHTEAERLI